MVFFRMNQSKIKALHYLYFSGPIIVYEIHLKYPTESANLANI